MLPPSQRCRDQTTKAPTGPFQREKLLQYLEETAKKEEDWIEHVPFSPGTKRGKKVLKNLGRTIALGLDDCAMSFFQ